MLVLGCGYLEKDIPLSISIFCLIVYFPVLFNFSGFKDVGVGIRRNAYTCLSVLYFGLFSDLRYGDLLFKTMDMWICGGGFLFSDFWWFCFCGFFYRLQVKMYVPFWWCRLVLWVLVVFFCELNMGNRWICMFNVGDVEKSEYLYVPVAIFCGYVTILFEFAKSVLQTISETVY